MLALSRVQVHVLKQRLPASGDTPAALNILSCYETILTQCEAVNRSLSESFKSQRLNENPAAPPDEVHCCYQVVTIVLH